MKKYSQYVSPEIDLAQFDDPVALTAQWSSMYGTSANFTTHILVEKDADVLMYQPTKQNIAFCFGFTLFSGFAFVMAILFPRFILGTVICGLFLAVGILLIRNASGPVVFDKGKRIFYKGWRTNKQIDKKTSTRLEDIHAIQLLENRTGAELNLVIKDGSRVSVITQSSKRQMSIDGDYISKFLDVPVWDAIPNLKSIE